MNALYIELLKAVGLGIGVLMLFAFAIGLLGQKWDEKRKGNGIWRNVARANPLTVGFGAISAVIQGSKTLKQKLDEHDEG